MRSLSVELNLIVSLWQYPLHTEAEELGLLLGILVDGEFLIHNQVGLGGEGIGDGQLCLHGRQVINYLHGTRTGEFLCRHALELHPGIEPSTELVLQICSVVVVGGCTPEVGSHGEAILQHGLAIDIHIVEFTRPAVHRDGEATCTEGVAGIHLVQFYRSLRICCLAESLGGCGETVAVEHKLLGGHSPAGLEQGFVLLQDKVHVECQLGIPVGTHQLLYSTCKG